MDQVPRKKRWGRSAHVLLFLLLATDLGYSFLQYFHQPMDGDMAWNAIPSADLWPVLSDPLGLDAILHQHAYPNPNRFFCHWSIRTYLLNAPLLLQAISTPIDSAYLACALAKVIMHGLLVFLLAALATGYTNVRDPKWMFAAVLIMPLFQANGYRSQMGVIDPSTTYSFFYALPCVFLLLYFLPMALHAWHGRTMPGRAAWNWWWTVPFACVVCLSGPLDPGAILVLMVTLALFHWHRQWARGTRNGRDVLRAVPSAYWPFIIPAVALSCYSLLLGRYNSITLETQAPLLGMYAQLPRGILQLFTEKLGPLLLSIALVINLWLLKRLDAGGSGSDIRAAARWFGLFAVLYVVLLPLGGYRDYRPFIVRYDTLLPITLGAFTLFAASSLRLLAILRPRAKRAFGLFLVAILAVFTVADEPEFHRTACERQALEYIAASTAPVVPVPLACTIMDWQAIPAPDRSLLKAELLHLWRVTDRVKPYFNTVPIGPGSGQ